ncbi:MULTISPECIES: UDP-N-acetylmuramoyl-tripeptide--D-alanyl-D-alanine ligase [unclassified Enterococcus]|uniref:UDP-N-acetylmuramoyl-tripeptide--D-alanyl-D- alanine ligase n=1 Tax=unclassified Enterococcus TaxID=2608891 RepID=UPI001554B163|nr:MULTISPECIES: UDP-N-acetylmuramoyl-tripeptide--D-alanyl-D-alanine ligase [unclassified Enterococcus]MBS7577276.1 UDP-N-acetylmuramoyl-tripeptide--D-alanyl-D-alanine ligase [Enterococcus sp. MMGLQ5-2]MBS7584631.1 UDP-N-acetylmuramoyl-tripeptide--D-alanyl-D-alanine ligase [Enterococcus sp. MMGLQ5-1]NPD12486.1 UDP-N-acetylmuramoyl-tripeptide--D-alanyl-D-alanine ligase [Enterococcus sp. MMGLQ5-1]NPD37110.1 UDP-N-acetylmuramoyl-tripeptide--D-alanyl-D-alanine ligase [Enterococcus sp. MMGLQ5-2]
MKLTLHQIGAIVSAENDYQSFPDLIIGDFEFDSRKIKAGDCFLPLRGSRDGHDFIDLAKEKGAIATFSERDISNMPYLKVKDNLVAFQQLASYVRQHSDIKVIAITGSNGKTTTKDMIAAVMSEACHTYKTQGNYNNEIGLPYTILHMPEETTYLVLEMGQDHFGDIRLLSEIARPDIAVITMIGEAHLEFFGSREKIAEGKMQIQDGLSENGLLVIPDDEILDPYIKVQRVKRFGESGEIFITNFKEGKTKSLFSVNFAEGEFEIPLSGLYNAKNALLAIYVGLATHQLTISKIHHALVNLKLTRNRTEWLYSKSGIEILSDVYNANPTAMGLTLDSFLELPGQSKIAVLADMKELGAESKALHQSMILHLNPEKLQRLFLYGEEMWPLAELAAEIYPRGAVRFYQKNANIDEKSELIEDLLDCVSATDQVLLKGSNSMHLDQAVEKLLEK